MELVQEEFHPQHPRKAGPQAREALPNPWSLSQGDTLIFSN